MPSISFPSCLWYLKFVYKTFTSVEVVLTRKWSTYRKYEEICAPQVEEFCFITDNTYFKEEVSLLSFNFWSLHFLMASTIVAILPSLHYDSAFVILQVLEMESSILNYLKFEMTAPTAKCFLRWKNCHLFDICYLFTGLCVWNLTKWNGMQAICTCCSRDKWGICLKLISHNVVQFFWCIVFPFL